MLPLYSGYGAARFDLANMRQVPPVDTHTPFEEYISKELLPYFQEHCIPPAKRISLRDAVYTYKYKNEPDGGILKKYLMQEPAYLEFRLQQQEKGHCTGASRGTHSP